MEDKYIVTIDLGTRNLSLAVGKAGDNGKIDICYYNEFPSEGISHGKVLNPTRLGGALKTAVSSAENFLGIKINEVMVNCQKYDIRQVEKRVVREIDEQLCISKEQLEMLEDLAAEQVMEELENGEEIISLVVQNFNTDDEFSVNENDVVGMMSSHLEGIYKIFIGKSASSKYIDAAFSSIGINLVRKVFVPDYVGKCCLSRSEIDGGVALFDLGAGASSVSVFYGGVLRHYGAIPFGSRNITADIANLCEISDSLAENIKMGYGGCMPDKLESLGEKTLRITDSESSDRTEFTAKYLSEIITAREKEIIDALLYEIQLSGYADKLKNGVVLVGGGANMLNICNLIKLISGYNARVAAPGRTIFNSSISSFFNMSAAMQAALLLRLSNENVSCTEKAQPQVESVRQNVDEEEVISNADDVRSNLLFSEEETQRSSREEKREKKEKKEKKERKEKKQKEETRKSWGGIFGNLSSAVFGEDSDPENEI